MRVFLTKRRGKLLSEAPFRAELPDTHEVAARCREMAGVHGMAGLQGVAGARGVASGNNVRDLFAELRKSERILWKIHQTRAKLDNFYIILAEIQKTGSLLRRVDPRLPRIQDGDSQGMLRLYALAIQVVSWTNSRIERSHLARYIEAYQSVSGLLTGELMAMQAIFKLALIGNLRRLADRLAPDPAGERKQLQEQDAADRASWRNAISSLRFLDTIEWPELIYQLSVLEPVLCCEQSAIYPKMDLYSRERYRKEVGQFAKWAKVPETQVAYEAVRLAKQADAALQSDGGDHVGYYLIGKGRRIMERSLGIRRPVRRLLRGLAGVPPLRAYLCGILAIALLIVAGLSAGGYTGYGHPALQVVVLLSLLLCASEVARLIVDAFVGFACETAPLPKLDFSQGIPRQFSTLVIVPSLLTSAAEIEELVHMLEVRFIAGKGENLHFGLLTDFKDAGQAALPEDEGLLELVSEKINALNRKYRHSGSGLFFLFHRPRKWNPREQAWMGYERKRGKIMELNGLLRGRGKENFSRIIGDTAKLAEIKYVITVDSDTQLPREAACKMIAAMAHPLNRARYDEKKKRVTSGYGILQPRIRTDLRGAGDSRYQRIYGHGPDMDPYTYATPDVYQDLFGEGSYTGKGIYDVDILLQTLEGRLPENRILSHDLLEGCYARAGLLNDLKLFERSFNYWVEVKRRHRWIRGDWQIAAWIGPLVPGPGKKWGLNPLSALSRWKILDNLRVSLLPTALLLVLLLGWTVLPNSGMFTVLALTICLFPALTIVAGKLLERPAKILLWQQWSYAFSEASSRFEQCGCSFICLPYESFYTLHAIALACWRMLVSRKGLLEWTPSGSRETGRPYRLADVYRKMWIAPLLSVMLCVAALLSPSAALWWEIPVLLCWIVAPFVVWWLNRPLDSLRQKITPAQEQSLRKHARRTWAYFDQLVAEEGSWLPPDHYQEYPLTKVAAYTSPTNMGLSLLSGLTAADLGYQTRGRFLERTGRSLTAMNSLERYRGHFYNWYDTRLMQPSFPRYVSSVDSGNLSGHLYILRQALLAMPQQPVIGAELFSGLQDTLGLLEEALSAAPSPTLSSPQPFPFSSPPSPLDHSLSSPLDHSLSSQLAHSLSSPLPLLFSPSLQRCKAYLQELSGSPLSSLDKAGTAVRDLKQYIDALVDELEATPHAGDSSGPEAPRDPMYWARALQTHWRDIAEELATIAPWLSLPPAPEKYRYLVPGHISSRSEVDTALQNKVGSAFQNKGEPALPNKGDTALQNKVGSALPNKGDTALQSEGGIPSLNELAELEARVPVLEAQAQVAEDADGSPESLWLDGFRKCAGAASRVARERLQTIARLISLCDEFTDNDYSFLYNQSEQLLSIGYHVDDGRADTDYYDLLASEARLATFIGICQGKLPVKSWFALGRTMADIDHSLVLLSAGGTLFEYLMPLLVMPVFEDTLLDHACKSCVRQQIAHGTSNGIPWGVSESCYSTIDASQNYQYKIFGIPALSLKHVYSEEDKVVAPYATMLALMITPEEACSNLQRLQEQEAVGRYGFYEAVDYTPSRLPAGQQRVIVRSYMAHHQGMSLLAIGNLLLSGPLQKLFYADPELESSLELLQEKIPEDIIVHPHLGRKTAQGDKDIYTVEEAWKGIPFFRQLAESVIRTARPHDPVPMQYGELAFFQPSVLVRVSHTAHIELIAHMIQIHSFWRSKGLAVTLVIWNEDRGCYRDFLQRLVIELITGGIGAEAFNRHGGGIFVKVIDTLSEHDHAFLQIATRIVAASHQHDHTAVHEVRLQMQ